MAIILSVFDDRQVASVSSFEVLVGEPGQRLIIMSGIAIPEFRTNHDEEVRQDEIVVRLGVHVSALDKAVAHVGLASISNDETNFLFALDTAQVEVETGTGELLLRVTAAILGEETLIHRFGYQVVAHVRKVVARISGVISVPIDILDVSHLSLPEVGALFEITANRVERKPPPPGGGGFGFERFIPVATGVTGKVRRGAETTHFVDYVIDGCPFNTPLQVKMEPVGHLATLSSVVVGQVAGPRPVVLTNLAPDASGVDFAVVRLPPVR